MPPASRGPGEPGSINPGGDNPHTWFDEDAGPLVRSYAMTRGRVRPTSDAFDLVSYVVVTPQGMAGERDPAVHQPEHELILALVGVPTAVADVASDLDLPLGVVRVLLSDLLDEGAISVHEPPPVTYLPDEDLLKAVIDGLRTI